MDRKYFNQHFMRYYNSEPVLKLIDCRFIYLYRSPNLTIQWYITGCILIIQTKNVYIEVSSDYPCNDNKKHNILNALELIQEVRWNKVGEPVKRDLLNYLYQLHQLDIPLTKPAK